MTEKVETIVIGAGHAGLAASYSLMERGREHVILERSKRAGHVWRDERWDSFTLVTPNWTVQLPGAEYNGADRGGFMPRDEVAAMLEAYPDRFHLPISYETTVSSVERAESGNEFLVHADGRDYPARNVVIATGYFQQPKIPAVASQLPPGIQQFPARDYRNPPSLAPGAVLVVGSGQTGSQIAEDLQLAGRKVYLSVGSAGRTVRRYRGKDIWEWLNLTGFLDRTPDMLPSPAARFMVAPQLTGARGGHSISLHRFAREGIVLLGHLQAADNGILKLAPDVIENIARGDKMLQDQLQMIDAFIARTGLDAPLDEVPDLHDDYMPQAIGELDLGEANITSVIWASGFRFDYSWVRPALLDEFGFPKGAGVANLPGLYFAGLPWMPRFSTGLMSGIGAATRLIAEQIAARDVRG